MPHWAAAPGRTPEPATLRLESEMSYPPHVPVQAVVSVITGILILIMPKLLNYIVAIYLILSGLLMMLRY